MKKFLTCALTFFSAAALVFGPSCELKEEDKSNYTAKTVNYGNFGTSSTLYVNADFTVESNVAAFDALKGEVEQFLNELESSIASDISTSYISRFNSADPGEWVEVDESTYIVLSDALYMYELTGGYYNPAVYYSVDLFGFTPRFNTYTFEAPLSTRTPYDRLTDSRTAVAAYKEPDEHYVEIFRDLASHACEIEPVSREGKYYVYKPDYTVTGKSGDVYSMALDLGGIGKGYAADVVNSLIEEYGFKYSYFTLGSSSYYINKHATSEDGTWGLGLTDPDYSILGGTYAKVYVSDVALSSSGDYEKVYKSQSGNAYCHIIDPFTGRPKTIGIAGCTVIGGTAARDDALTTALTVMGEEKAVQFINEYLKDYMVTMIVRGSSGACEHIITNVRGLEYNTAYMLANTIDGNGNIILK